MKKLRFLTIIIILLSFSCLACKKDNHDDTDLLKHKTGTKIHMHLLS